MRSLTAVLLTAIIALPAAAQQPAYGERVDVTAVLLDVVVTDNRGNQILGLTKDDFTVRENGVKQTVDSVDYVTSRRLLTNREEKLPFDVEHVKEERYIVFFFDKPEAGAMFEHVARARRAAAEFIKENMGGSDLAAVVGHDVRLKVYSDFTSNKQQLKKALDRVATFGPGETKATSPAGTPSILRNIDSSEMMSGSGTVYEGLRVLADGLRDIRGRKNLVLFSPGIVEPGEIVRGGILLNTSRYYEPMIEALHAANVTVFASNLVPNAPSEPVFHQTLERIAGETNGGYFRHAISFTPVLEEVEKASGGYYLITYRSSKPRGARGFQKVSVSINNPEFVVKARPGYVYGE
ncbi:MAG TPA: VWA domain-containing protein [Thermoanaerobaculia bacterium]|nr:VWA domain-containing protein [Thermoanaerobaculia bacterium]